MTADATQPAAGDACLPGLTSPALEARAPAWLASSLVAGGPQAESTAAIEQSLDQGRAHLVGGRYRQAYELFVRASQQAHAADLPAAEARAQAFLAHAAATLGHSEEGIETAMLATQLAQGCPDDELLHILVNNYLGVTLLWNGSHEGAEAVLAQTYERAKQLPRGEPDPGHFWQPMINRGFNEACKLFALRHLRGHKPNPRRLQTMLDALDAHAGARGMGLAPASLMLSGQLSWLRAWAAAWAGQLAPAREHEEALRSASGALADSPRLQALADWLRAELALAAGRREEALLAARKMRAVAERIEHWPLQRIALLLKSHLHEMSGRSDAALDCLRQLQQREHQLRQVSMHHRRDVAALRFELRQHKLEVQSLKSSAQQLQRLSMEDALTGLANRRGLELRLGEALAGAARQPEGMALYLSVVDVDRFKSVNDRHSHQVGDQVLKALAALFQQLLRGQDIAGRWGGDEFVLAFWAPDEAQAQAVTERLRLAVRQHPWGMLAEGLSVSISLGLTRAHPGDSLDALLLRSDLGMYAHKRQQPVDAPPRGN